jgi:putative ABC transport system permease protein
MRFGGLFNKGRKDRELHAELESHIQMHTEDNLRSGMTPGEARRQAMIKMGGIESTKQACREQRGLPLLETLWQDLQFAARMLRKNPGFTTVAVLTLALGIGVNTAIFSMTVSALWRPLPLPESDRLVEIGETDLAHTYDLGTSGGEFLDWKENCRSFSEVAAIWYENLNLDTSADAERLNGARVTENFFRTLNVLPRVGRYFSAADIEAGRDNLAVISDQFCKKHFGGESGVVGETLRLNGETYQIIGVAAPEVRSFGGASVWLPLVFSQRTRDARGYRTIARLKRDVSPAQARSEMAVVAARIGAEFPSIHSHLVIDLSQFSERFGGSLTLFHALLAIVGIVLIIACANLAGLLSVRSVYRRQEIGVRGALGATRLRIVRQLVVESLVLSCLGGVMGVLFAVWGFDLILGLVPSGLAMSLTGISELSLDWRVIGFACALSLGSGILFGLVPAIETSRHTLASTLQSGRGGGGGYQSKRLSEIFLCTHVAICFACVSVIGTILLSVNSFLDANPGFDQKNLLTLKLTLAGPEFAVERQRIAFVEQLDEQIKALPSVQSVASADILPFAGMRTAQINVEGEASRGGRDTRPLVASVSPDYFATMKEPLVRGRVFTSEDDSRGLPVALINENLARDLFGTKGNAIGRRILLRGQARAYEVVGIVGNVHHEMLNPGKAQTPKLYLSQLQDCPSEVSIVIRTKAKMTGMLSAVRKAVSESNRHVAIFDIKMMSERIADDQLQQMTRFGAGCLTLFASLALVMTVIGVHGTIGHAIVQRSREFGVRLALGSTAMQLVMLVTRQGMKTITVGLLLGFLVSAGLHMILTSSLGGVAPPTLGVFTAISAAVIGSLLVACLITALRVRTTNPIDALRHE